MSSRAKWIYGAVAVAGVLAAARAFFPSSSPTVYREAQLEAPCETSSDPNHVHTPGEAPHPAVTGCAVPASP